MYDVLCLTDRLPNAKRILLTKAVPTDIVNSAALDYARVCHSIASVRVDQFKALTLCFSAVFAPFRRRLCGSLSARLGTSGNLLELDI